MTRNNRHSREFSSRHAIFSIIPEMDGFRQSWGVRLAELHEEYLIFKRHAESLRIIKL